MTAEIAILNRTAVTLASDSAVTLSVGGRTKIYQSVDKIFELSLSNPVALMVYNNLEYHDIPLEIIIKKFRASSKCRSHKTLFGCADSFLKYLREYVHVPESLANRHVYSIVSDEYKNIRDRLMADVTERFRRTDRDLDVDIRSILTSVLRYRIKELENMAVSACFHDVDYTFVLEAHTAVFDIATEDVIGKERMDDELRSCFRLVGALLLHRDVFSDSMTGLVFAGFGSRELFPSLQAVEIDGIIAGRLKQRLVQKTDIDRDISSKGDVNRRLVQIVPFAQTDMAQRFLEGIDPRLEHEIVRSVEAAYKTALDKFRSNPAGLSPEAADAAAALLDTYLAETLAHFRDDALTSHKARQRQEIEDMALMMPKQELAFLAEAIINLTSIKRKGDTYV